jgi:hypothetical protein
VNRPTFRNGVEPVRGDDAGDAEQRTGAQEIPGQRPTVLPGRDFAAGCKEVRGGEGAPRGPIGDQKRQRHEGEEEADGKGIVAHLRGPL